MKHSQAILILAFVAIMAFVGNRVNNDVWFLLGSGRYLEAFGIPHIEPFTLHDGFHFVMQQWLFALGLWQLYGIGGVYGLVAFSWVAGALLLLLYYRLQLRVTGGNESVSSLLTAVVLVFAGWIFITQRPQMASSLIFLVEICLLERQRARMARTLPVVFFVLSALLVNLHAAMWPLLLVFLLPYLLESLVGGRFRWCRQDFRWPPRELLLLLCVSLLGGFCNPYGLEAMAYAAHGYGSAEINALVGEMTPLSMKNLYVASPLFIVLAALGLYARRAVPLRYQLLALGTGMMALLSYRSFFLFLLFGTLGIGYMFRDWQEAPGTCTWPQLRRRGLLLFFLVAAMDLVVFLLARETVGAARQEAFFLLVALALLGVLVCAYRLYRERVRADVLASGEMRLTAALLAIFLLPLLALRWQPPHMIDRSVARSAELLLAAQQPSEIRLYTGYDDGDYMEYCGIPCYLDARAEVFLPQLNHQKNVLREYIDLRYGLLDYREFQRRYSFTHFLTTDDELLYTYLAADPDYVLLYDSEEDDSLSEAEQQEEKHVRLYAYRPAAQ